MISGSLWRRWRNFQNETKEGDPWSGVGRHLINSDSDSNCGSDNGFLFFESLLWSLSGLKRWTNVNKITKYLFWISQNIPEVMGIKCTSLMQFTKKKVQANSHTYFPIVYEELRTWLSRTYSNLYVRIGIRNSHFCIDQFSIWIYLKEVTWSLTGRPGKYVPLVTNPGRISEISEWSLFTTTMNISPEVTWIFQRPYSVVSPVPVLRLWLLCVWFSSAMIL